MDRIQEVLFEALIEIDRICRENGLDYFLGNETAFCALRWGHFGENCNSASVFMPAWDYDRFEVIARSASEKYEVESIKTNAKFPFTLIHFVDKNTTAINLSMIGLQEKPGISVKIIKLVPFTPKENNDGLDDKIALGAALYEETFGSVVKYPKDYSSFRVNRIKHNSDFARDIYCSLLDREQTSMDKYFLQQHRAALKYFPAKIIDGEKVEVELEGVNFYVPSDYKKFMNILYGRRWRIRDIEFKPRSYNFIMDTETPYECYLPILDSLLDEAQNYREAKRDKTPYDKSRKDISDSIDRQNWYYERTVDRFHCIDIFVPDKENILQLYVEGQFAELSLRLADYQSIAEKYIRRGLPFSFDKDFYVILCDVLVWQGLISLSKKMVAQKKEAYNYLDYASKDNSRMLMGSIYKYNTNQKVLVRTRGEELSVPIATSDEMEGLAYRILEKLESEEEADGAGDDYKEENISTNFLME